MDFENTIANLIQKGDVFTDVPGNSVSEIYKFVSESFDLPSEYDPKNICAELLERENVLSTAVGNGIALPHPRRPLLKNADEQRIYVCYLREPINMNAPDSRKVFVLFILFTSNTQSHIKILSELAKLFRSVPFRKFLETKPDQNELVDFISKGLY